MTTLKQEEFDTIKALAEVQTSLSQGQAELLKLKQTTEEYVVVREKEAEEKVLEVLKDSREALEEASKNHQELSSYGRDLKAYANELSILSTSIETIFKDFNDQVKQAEKDMVEHHKNISDILTQTKAERTYINGDRKMLERERKQTNDEARLLIDRKATLIKGFEELKRLKNKKD